MNVPPYRALLLPAVLLMSLAALPASAKPNFAGQTDRPLHYKPDGGTFVVENGAEFFNRPLYGGNTAFRADAGDKPELSLYLPGRGGNLRLGIATPDTEKWLHQASRITTRYVPGSMVYDIRDSLLSGGTLHLDVQAMPETEGVVVRAEIKGTTRPLQLVWAYGGANGERGARNGDIGTEKLPVSQFFQLKPDYCRNSAFALTDNSFTLRTARADIAGLASQSTLAIADAAQWNDLSQLLLSEGRATQTPIVVGRAALVAGQPLFVSLERVGGGTEGTAPAKPSTYQPQDLARVFDQAEARRQRVASQIGVETPDAFINALAPALCIAADGVWDAKEGAFMHGAVAWRNKLLGWRGAYSGDTLGQHERTRSHLMNWLPRQNVTPVAPGGGEPQAFAPDASVNFARNETPLHSNGDLTGTHYDMNLPAIDILFRHLQWTGDLQFAREVWPVIERHMAWERRLFRRPFGPDGLPLYEAYAAIWASDDLAYEGGGATHGTAYNLYHNRQAARLARLIGQDPAPYEREAGLIEQAMQRELWLKDRGWFAEWKDLLGLQLTHPDAAVWTFYHTLDSEAATPLEAWQMSRFVDTQIPHIPVQGKGVPDGGFYTLSTSSWMPYTWSTNNVVMAESAHTALGYWQAGRQNEAFRLFKGCVLDHMFLGLSPGNVGMASQFDMARGESQRDFADGVGATSRALVEGLFGVKPDALSGELLLRPAFPADWNHASLRHENVRFEFRRDGTRETYTVEPKFSRPMTLRLQVVASRDTVASVTVNGQPATWRMLDGSVGTPRIEIVAAAAPRIEVVVAWRGRQPATAKAPAVVARGETVRVSTGAAHLLQIADPQGALSNVTQDESELRATPTGTAGHRTAFARVRQGDLTWWQPVMWELRAPLEIIAPEAQPEGELHFIVRNNTPEKVSGAATIRVGQQAYQRRLSIPARGQSSEMTLPGEGLMPGSNMVRVEMGLGRGAEGVVTNWQLKAPATRWESVELGPLFNDRVTRIFQNSYDSPRSPYVSLAIPRQGIGSWAHWNENFAVDDAGLRSVAAQNGGRLMLPQGVPLQTPGTADAPNIAFVSQWDFFPRQIEVPLSGQASHAYLLMAGSTNSMQSRFDNGEVIVTYADNTTQRLPLHNPTTWWPIDQDYKIDDFAFNDPAPLPPRVDLKTGTVRVLDKAIFKGKGGKVPGGAATVLDLPLQPGKPLRSLMVRALANEVVIGLMSVTLAR